MTKLSEGTESTKDFSQEPPLQHSKRAFFVEITISILYSLLKLVLIIVVVFFAASLSLSDFKSSAPFLRAQENVWLWEQEIIVDLRVVQTVNCPQDWEEYANYSWSGNIEGCSCAFAIGLFEYNAVLEGRCSQREFEKGCRSVPAHTAIPFQFWKADAHLCVKRLHNYNFYSSEANIVNPNGHNITNCSKGKPYQIDLIEPIPCPITNMANQTIFNESIPQLDFTFSREENYPLVYFRISQYSFCESLSEHDKSPGRTSNYILERHYQYECNQSDPRTIAIDSQGEADFFAHNPRIQAVTSTLPAYPTISNQYEYRLGFIRYPPWSYSCRSIPDYSLQRATLFLELSEIEPAIVRLQALCLVSTLFSLVFLGYFWVSSYLHLRTKHMHGYLYLKDYQIRRINPHTNIVKNRSSQMLKFVAYEVSPVAAILFLIILYFQLNQAKQWFLGAEACTEGSFKGHLRGYEQFIGSEMVVTLSSIFVSLAIICLDACYLLWRWFKGDLEEEQEEELQQDSPSDKEGQKEDGGCNLKQISVTQEFLVDNSFGIQHQNKLNIYTFQEDEQVVSEYSQSSKSD